MPDTWGIGRGAQGQASSRPAWSEGLSESETQTGCPLRRGSRSPPAAPPRRSLSDAGPLPRADGPGWEMPGRSGRHPSPRLGPESCGHRPPLEEAEEPEPPPRGQEEQSRPTAVLSRLLRWRAGPGHGRRSQQTPEGRRQRWGPPRQRPRPQLWGSPESSKVSGSAQPSGSSPGCSRWADGGARSPVGRLLAAGGAVCISPHAPRAWAHGPAASRWQGWAQALGVRLQGLQPLPLHAAGLLPPAPKPAGGVMPSMRRDATQVNSKMSKTRTTR